MTLFGYDVYIPDPRLITDVAIRRKVETYNGLFGRVSPCREPYVVWALNQLAQIKWLEEQNNPHSSQQARKMELSLAHNSSAGKCVQSVACIFLSVIAQKDMYPEEAVACAEEAVTLAGQHITTNDDLTQLIMAQKRLAAAHLHLTLSKRMREAREQIHGYNQQTQDEIPRSPSRRDTAQDLRSFAEGAGDKQARSDTPWSPHSQAERSHNEVPQSETTRRNACLPEVEIPWRNPSRPAEYNGIAGYQGQHVMQTLLDAQAKIWDALHSTVAYLEDELELLSKEYPGVTHIPAQVLLTTGDGCEVCPCWDCYRDRLGQCKRGCRPASRIYIERVLARYEKLNEQE